MTWVLRARRLSACLCGGARLWFEAAALSVAVLCASLMGACDTLLNSAVRLEDAVVAERSAFQRRSVVGVAAPDPACGAECPSRKLSNLAHARGFKHAAPKSEPSLSREPEGYLDPWAMVQGLAFEVRGEMPVSRSPRVEHSRLVWLLGPVSSMGRDGARREGSAGPFRWNYGPTPFQQLRLDIQGSLPLVVAGTQVAELREHHLAHAVCLLESHPAAELNPVLPTVVLDPGHGGANVGASYKHFYESDLVLDIAHRTRLALQASWPSLPVLLTRTDNRYVPLNERSRLAVAVDASLFVSIHLNDSDHPIKGGGVTTYYFGQSEARHLRRRMARHLVEVEAAPIASMIESHRLQGLSRASARLAKAVHEGTLAYARKHRASLPDRGVRTEPFSVLVEADMPAVLLEASFLSEDGEADLLVSEAYRQSLAEGAAAGIIRYLLDRAAVRSLSPAGIEALQACGRLPRAAQALPGEPTS